MTILPCLFCVYWCSVLAWSVMADQLCSGLSRRHPLVWAALGRAAGRAGEEMRWAPPLGREMALLGFLLRRRDRFLEDRPLVRLCAAMRALLAGYLLLFLTFPVLLG